MSDTLDRQSLSVLHAINANIQGRNKQMADTNNQMMLKVLLQINENLMDLKRTMERLEQDGLRVRTQESHAP